MKSRKTVINTHNILVIVLFALFVVFAVVSATEGETWLAVFFGMFCLLPAFVFAISPLCYIFDEKAVTIVYFFGLRETVSWSSIRDIYEIGGWFLHSVGTPRYVLSYPKKEKQVFFMLGEISKTRKTTEFIKRYYGKI